MITFKDSITVYTKKHINGIIRWTRTAINNVSWFGRNKTNTADSGRNPSSNFIVRIPLKSMPSNFVDPDVWNETDEPAGMTIQNDDYIVKGIVDFDITELNQIINEYEEAFLVTSFTDNRRGYRFMQHYRVEGNE